MMQCGQIERIWYEDGLFSSYIYRHAPIDEANFPTQGLYPTVWGEAPRSRKVDDHSAISAVPLHSQTDPYEAAVTH